MYKIPRAKFCCQFSSVRLDQCTKKKKRLTTSGHITKKGFCQIEKAKQKDEGFDVSEMVSKALLKPLGL